MNCRRIQDLIPLYVGGDLDRKQSLALESHIVRCGDCSLLADEHRASREWLRESGLPAFDAGFYDEIRRGVWREVDERSERPSPFRVRLSLAEAFAFASVALAALFLGITFYAYSLLPGDLPEQEIPAYLRGDAERPGVPRPEDQPGAPGLNAAEPPERIERATAARAGRAPGGNRRGHLAAAKTSNQSMQLIPTARDSDRSQLRMEFQTGDPNIRIIWFAPDPAAARDSQSLTGADSE